MPVKTDKLKSDHPHFSADEARFEVLRPGASRPKLMSLSVAEKTLADMQQRRQDAIASWDRRVQTAQDVVNSIKAAE